MILLGDNSVWAPAGGEKAEGLWLHLRLLFCRAVEGNGRRCSAGGGGGHGGGPHAGTSEE